MANTFHAAAAGLGAESGRHLSSRASALAYSSSDSFLPLPNFFASMNSGAALLLESGGDSTRFGFFLAADSSSSSGMSACSGAALWLTKLKSPFSAVMRLLLLEAMLVDSAPLAFP